MYKILVFGMTENPGGVESVIMNYYHYMDKNTFHFDFLCNSYNKIAFEEEIISNGSQTFHFPARSKNYKKYKKELKNFFENNASKYDAIWVNVCSLANIDYLKMAKKYGIKRRIIHSHNSQNMDSRLRGILHKYNKKRIAYYVTDFWSCSKEASEWFYDSSIIKKSIIISNAIDVEKYCFDDVKRKKLRRDLKWEENYIIGNIGRLHFQKNQMFILDIFEKLIKKEPKVRLILIGDGEDKTKLEKEIDKKKLNKYVYMAGIQKDICGWLSTFDLFLFPSKFEYLFFVFVIASFVCKLETKKQIVIVSFCWCIGVILYKGLDQYHVLGDPLYYLLWFYLGYRLENMIEWLKKHNIWKDSSILCLFGLVCLSFIVDKIVKIHFFHFLSSYIVCPFFMLIVLNYIVRHIKINGRAIKSLSDYGMGIYLYAEPLNYLFLFWFYRFCGIEFFGSEFGAAIIYFSRIVITPIIAIGITWILKKFNLKYLY